MNTPYDEMTATDDMLDWEEETDNLLPMDAAKIAELEKQGYIVDLESGEVFADPDAPADSLATQRQIRNN